MPPSLESLNNLVNEHLAAQRWQEAIDVLRQMAALDPTNADVPFKLGQLLRHVGRREEACAAFAAVARMRADVADVYLQLATVQRELGRLGDAAASYGKLLALRPNDAAMTNDLANLLNEMGDLQGAIAQHRRAVTLQPSLAEAHFNLANELYISGSWEEAIDHYGQAIAHKPQFEPAYYQMGNALAAHDRLEEAIDSLRRATVLQPAHAEAWYNLSHALNRAERKEEAIAACRQTLAVKPDFVDAHVNLGSMLQDLDRHNEAMAVYQRGLAIKPDSAELLCNLGSALYKLDRDDEAMVLYQRAVSLRPDCREGWHNLGNAWERHGNSDEALVAYQKALAISPDNAESLNSLGALYYHRGRMSEAKELLEKSVAVQPRHASSRLNLGLFRLIHGDFEQGLRDYEARFEANKSSQLRNFTQPLWDGGDLNGRIILLHAEQGLGDAIQFLRYVPMVQGRGGRVIVRCWQALKRLFAGQLGIEYVFHELDPAPEFDVQFPMVSLARLFWTTLATIPTNIPYLLPQPNLVEKWRQLLSPHARELNIGLSWAGNPKHVRDRERSIPLRAFAPLAQANGVQFHSLQIGAGSEQVKDPPPGMNLIDWSGELKNMAETAALIQNLDLVISVDTSVVHLTGALGKPAWVLLTFIPDWRWLLDRDDSPWYPTLKLFRQIRERDWTEPIERVAEELLHFVSSSGRENS